MKRKEDIFKTFLSLATPVALFIVALSLLSLSASIRDLADIASPHTHHQPISIAIGTGESAAPPTNMQPGATTTPQPATEPHKMPQPLPSEPAPKPSLPSSNTVSASPPATPPDTTATNPASQPKATVQAAAPTGVNHIVQALNNSAEGAMVFSPGYIKIAPGDSITFQPTSYGHNSQTPEDIIGSDFHAIPADAAPWAGAMNEEFTVTFTVPGVYLYLCNYHYVVGHVGVIQVGDDISNLQEVQQAGKALKNKMFSNANRVDLYLSQVR